MKKPKPLGVPLNKLHMMGIYTEKDHDFKNNTDNRDFKKEDRNSLESLQWELIQELEAEIDALNATISHLKASMNASPPTYKEVVTRGIRCALIGGNPRSRFNTGWSLARADSTVDTKNFNHDAKKKSFKHHVI